MRQDQSQDLDHFPVTSRIAEQMPLQPLEVLGKLKERCSVAQGSRLALDDRQIMPPVIDRVPGAIMGSIDDAPMFAYELPLGDNQEAIGQNAQPDGTIGQGCRSAVAVGR